MSVQRETAAEPTLRLRGKVLSIRYRDTAKSFWSSILVQSPDEPAPFTAVGEFIEIHEGDELTLYGRWETHPKYGRQFKVVFAKPELPTTEEGIIRYLSGGLFKGIGPKLAKRIVDLFGTDTLRVIAEEPERLRQIKGISERKYEAIVRSFTEQKVLHELALFLQSYGLSLNLVRRIYAAYGERALAVILDNPYRLIRDVRGIGFVTADRIALKIGIPADSPRRIGAAVLHVLDDACQNNGHVYLPEGHLLSAAVAFLNKNSGSAVISEVQVRMAIETLVAGEELVREEDGAIYPARNYHTERKLARLLQHLTQVPMRSVSDLDSLIAKVEQKLGKHYADEQKEAIRVALTAPVAVLTGGPGTGKSTVVHGVIETLREIEQQAKVALAAPTGKAANRLEEITGVEGKTIHRLLEFSPVEERFRRDADNPISADLVVVDETSMLELFLALALIQAIAPGTRLLFVGDPDQLPPVGIGNFLQDLIRSGVVPVVRLQKIFRQENAPENRIVLNAHRIKDGKMPDLSPAADFYFKEIKDYQELEDYVVEAVRTRLGKYAPEELMVLAPMRRSVKHLNTRLQSIINPPSPEKDEITVGERVFRVGDRVLQTANNYRLPAVVEERNGYFVPSFKPEDWVAVFNGETGTVMAIQRATEDNEQEDDLLIIRFDDRLVAYPLSEADSLALAYALTVHKSQGSEFGGVIFVICSMQHYIMLQRNLLYTAITRAKKYCFLIGQKQAVWRCVTNQGTQVRYTKLAERLRAKGSE